MALAVVVAFAAVAGAYRLASWILGGDQPQRRDGYLALITFGEGSGQGKGSAQRHARPA